MARIQQIHPGNYRSSGNIDDEFSSVIRYLVSGEKGDYTLGELLSVLFDDTGTLKSPVEMRLDGSTNLQYRVGSYTDSTSGWITIAPASAISGAPGADLGTIEGHYSLRGHPIQRHQAKPYLTTKSTLATMSWFSSTAYCKPHRQLRSLRATTRSHYLAVSLLVISFT